MAGDMKSALAARLKDARRQAKLSQEELAEKVGRSVDGISNIERGINLPSLDTLIDMCDALSISAAGLVEELQSPEKSPERQELEWQLKVLCHGLSDRNLNLAIDIISAIRRQPST
jgi:transcriptional regulator with XRE-family HTH domain